MHWEILSIWIFSLCTGHIQILAYYIYMPQCVAVASNRFRMKIKTRFNHNRKNSTQTQYALWSWYVSCCCFFFSDCRVNSISGFDGLYVCVRGSFFLFSFEMHLCMWNSTKFSICISIVGNYGNGIEFGCVYDVYQWWMKVYEKKANSCRNGVEIKIFLFFRPFSILHLTVGQMRGIFALMCVFVMRLHKNDMNEICSICVVFLSSLGLRCMCCVPFFAEINWTIKVEFIDRIAFGHFTISKFRRYTRKHKYV